MKPVKQKLSLNVNESQEIISAYKIAQALIGAGHEAVLAGGAVRDLLLGKAPKDYDIATSAKPEEVLVCFKKTQKVGIAFGVILVYDFGICTEVATFRTDGEYTDGRRPDSVIFSNAENDAQRRDFTINGLFYNFTEESVIDYVGGLNDLPLKLIKAIQEPEKRFTEDYLRMIRAVRFAVSLNFDIEKKTLLALQKFSPQIKNIAPDRIHVELRKTFSQTNSDRALNLLHESGLLKEIFPKVSMSDFFFNTKDFSKGGTFSVVLALLLHSLESMDALGHTLGVLRCANHEKREIKAFFLAQEKLLSFSSLNIAEQKRLVRAFNADDILYFISRLGSSVQNIYCLQEKINLWSNDDLNPPLMPSGKQLIQAGLKPGPNMGDYIKSLEDELLLENITTLEGVEEHLRVYLQTSLSR